MESKRTTYPFIQKQGSHCIHRLGEVGGILVWSVQEFGEAVAEETSRLLGDGIKVTHHQVGPLQTLSVHVLDVVAPTICATVDGTTQKSYKIFKQ